ncbi:MAG: serine/threonine protein kinase, partial [Mycobacterium sp.]|nr:serine/threonine protein kinase [Mycobacterium sp.]
KAMDAGRYTRTGEMLGTMAYLSPERIAGAPASMADDLYALGVVGFESLTGRPRFERDNVAALAHAIMTDQPPPVAALKPGVDPTLTALIDRATASDARARFPDAASMLTALHAGTPPARTPTRVYETPPPHQPVSLAYVPPRRNTTRRRTQLLAAIGTGVVATGATVVAIAAMNSPATPAVPAPQLSTTTPAPVMAPAVSSPVAPPEQDIDRGIGPRNTNDNDDDDGKKPGNGNGKKPKNRDR